MAKEILLKTHPGLIFLDLHMPQMNGKEFLSHLKEENIKIPVIVITGYPDEIPNLEAEAFEIKGFFPKPVRLEELFEEAKKILKLV
jgi:CheY-like chemotaxis protein